jgi:hypothetical protein
MKRLVIVKEMPEYTVCVQPVEMRDKKMIRLRYVGTTIIGGFAPGVHGFTHNKMYEVLSDFREGNGCLITLDDNANTYAVHKDDKDFQIEEVPERGKR